MVDIKSEGDEGFQQWLYIQMLYTWNKVERKRLKKGLNQGYNCDKRIFIGKVEKVKVLTLGLRVIGEGDVLNRGMGFAKFGLN